MMNVSEPQARADRPAADLSRGPSALGGQGSEASRVRSRFATCLALALAVLAAGTVVDWDSPEFGRHPDEAGHFITGTLVHDWAAGGFAKPPLEYGLGYYLRYPKVAFGHWPPFFHLVQGLWYRLAGVSRQSATLLMAVIAGGFLVTLFAFLRRQVSDLAALLATGLVVASPLFRYSSAQFMADLLVAWLSLAALWSYARFLDGGTAASSLAFGVFAALANLTKQDAVALGAVPPLAVLFLGRWGLLKDWRFYVPAAIVLISCIPYYAMTSHSTATLWDSYGWDSLWDRLCSLSDGLFLTGWSSIPVAASGVVILISEARRSPRVAAVSAVLAAHALGLAAVIISAPITIEPRYWTSLLPLAAYLASIAFHALLARDWGPAALRVVAAAGLAALLAADHPPYQNRKVAGYRSLVGEFTRREDLQVVLVCSDEMGDGAIVAEFRLQHPTDRFCVLRADKVLSTSTWMNRDYRLVLDSPEAIEGYMARQPVHFVVIDDWGKTSGEHHALLKGLLESHPDRFPLVGTFPVLRSLWGREQKGVARLYRVAATRDLHPRAIDVAAPGMFQGRHLKASTSDF